MSRRCRTSRWHGAALTTIGVRRLYGGCLSHHYTGVATPLLMSDFASSGVTMTQLSRSGMYRWPDWAKTVEPLVTRNLTVKSLTGLLIA